MKNALIAIVVIVVVAAGGVGAYVYMKDKNKKSNTTTTSSQSMDHMDNQSSQSSSSANTNETATDKVSIKDFAFSPTHISVKKGTTVTWTNQDSASHTVTSDDDSKVSFDSKTMAKGKTFTFTFNEAGTFSYHCTFHPNMTGSVTVTE